MTSFIEHRTFFKYNLFWFISKSPDLVEGPGLLGNEQPMWPILTNFCCANVTIMCLTPTELFFHLPINLPLIV